MKKYHFKLDPVLKLRKMKEENCRHELGELITGLSRIEAQQIHDRNEVENYYKIQQKSMENGISGGQLRAFPMLISAKNKNIHLLEIAQKKQLDLIEEKKQELATLRGELKVMEKLKEKDYKEYKKELNKRIDQVVEEQTQIWLAAHEPRSDE